MLDANTSTAGPIAPENTLMYSEASEAAAATARGLAANATTVEKIAARLRAARPRALITIARGSSDNAATYARYLAETRLGLLTSSAAPSVSSVYNTEQDLSGTAVLAISQSGRSPDLIAATLSARKSGAYTIAIVNDETSPLATMADACLGLNAGPEKSVAATKTYLTTNAAIAQLIAAWQGDADLIAAVHGLPECMKQAWAQDWSTAISHLQEAKDLYVVGRGIGFGAAQEAALKFKETSSLHAEAFSAAEVRHGPMALIRPGFPVFALSQNDETRQGVEELVEICAAKGADVLVAGFTDSHATELPTLPAHPVVQPILMMQSFYKMAAALSCARGYNPDLPPNLNKVTETV